MIATATLSAPAPAPSTVEDLDAATHRLVADLQTANPRIFWSDFSVSAVVGWSAFALAVVWPAWSVPALAAALVSSLALYRCLCFTHEITHLKRRAVAGFETVWNLLIGVPLLLPSFTYVGVHQSHHSLSTYGTQQDPEYLPFASSRAMILVFAVQSAFLVPVLLLLRFLVLAPLGLLVPPFHGFLERHASSFSMNPKYRRLMSAAAARTMRLWECAILLFWGAAGAATYVGFLPVRALGVWLGVLIVVSFLNTLRVLGAHEYESDGSIRDRRGQLADSIDTPGGWWTELWAPVGLRYHALHHYFPGIPYHNLGLAYGRIVATASCRSEYVEYSSPSLKHSLAELYRKAGGRS